MCYIATKEPQPEKKAEGDKSGVYGGTENMEPSDISEGAKIDMEGNTA